MVANSYFGDRPRWSWPNGARLAVWVIPNVEVFDPTRPIGGGSQVDSRAASLREYGNRMGLWRIREALDSLGVSATVALNASAIDAVPDVLRECVASGWELMGHGDMNNLKLADYGDREPEVIESCVARIREFTGQTPAGWLSPGIQPTPKTARLLAANGLRYTADCLNDDQPYVIDADGSELVALPYTLEANDLSAYERYHFSPVEFEELIRRQFDRLYADAAQTAMVMAVSLHPYLTGEPHRIEAFASGLRYILRHDAVWPATGSEIVDAYLSVQAGSENAGRATR